MLRIVSTPYTRIFLPEEGGWVVGLERACDPAQPFRRLGGEIALLRWKAQGETERGSPAKFENASSRERSQ